MTHPTPTGQRPDHSGHDEFHDPENWDSCGYCGRDVRSDMDACWNCGEEVGA